MKILDGVTMFESFNFLKRHDKKLQAPNRILKATDFTKDAQQLLVKSFIGKSFQSSEEIVQKIHRNFYHFRKNVKC